MEVAKIQNVSKQDMRNKIMEFENRLAKVPGAKVGDDCCPLKHTFADGCYIRQITMPKGMVLTSKIHKTEHPYFVMKGDCSVMTDDKVIRIKAPYWGITKPGTKRILYMHEETVWCTVHVTDSTDLKEIENQIIAPDFKNVIESKVKGGQLCHG